MKLKKLNFLNASFFSYFFFFFPLEDVFAAKKGYYQEIFGLT